MPEATKTCPSCGNEMAADSAFCPRCGAQQVAVEPAVAAEPVEAAAAGPTRFQATMEKVLATTKTHKWYWVGGGGGVLVVAVLAILFFTGVFGPSGHAICVASLNQAKEFGVISPSATLSSSSAKSTDVEGRRQCSAEAAGETFILQADVKDEDTEHKTCKDFAKQPDCLKLYSVARSDGMTTYQVREIPPGETDEAILAGQGAAQGAPPPAAPGNTAAPADAGGFDTPTAVDNGGNGASEQAPPTQTAPGDQPQQ